MRGGAQYTDITHLYKTEDKRAVTGENFTNNPQTVQKTRIPQGIPNTTKEPEYMQVDSGTIVEEPVRPNKRAKSSSGWVFLQSPTVLAYALICLIVALFLLR